MHLCFCLFCVVVFDLSWVYFKRHYFMCGVNYVIADVCVSVHAHMHMPIMSHMMGICICARM